MISNVLMQPGAKAQANASLINLLISNRRFVDFNFDFSDPTLLDLLKWVWSRKNAVTTIVVNKAPGFSSTVDPAVLRLSHVSIILDIWNQLKQFRVLEPWRKKRG